MTPLFSLTLLLTTAVLAVALARRLGLPSILAYLVIGALLGPHGLALVDGSASVEAIAEFGVVFLMFSIGLEFNLRQLKAMSSLVFGLGAAQMLLTAAATTLGTILVYQQDWRSGLAVGCAVAMSSTAIVARMLSERFELHSRSGRQTMGVLLFQDLAVVPCLILLPALAAPGEHLATALLRALAEASVVLVILIWLGQHLMRRLFDAVAHLRSPELFMLAILWIIVALAWLTDYAGLSLALGAFVGGMLISETRYRHQVEADVQPFRDVLLGLFFVTVGMHLDPGFMLGHLAYLLLAVLLLIGGKALVVLLVTLAARSPLDVALRTTGQLAQAGEFGLVLIGLAHQLKLIDAETFQLTLSAMLLSMFLAPGVIGHAGRLGARMARGRWAHDAKVIHDVAVGSMPLEQHVILCGYGRTGQQVSQFLATENIACIALDLDLNRVSGTKARAAPEPQGTPAQTVVFGNADRWEVLQAAGLARARAVVITYPDTPSALRVLHHVRTHRPGLPVIVRAADESDVARLKQAGATEVIPEVLEGSLMIAAETLTQLGVPVERAIGQVRKLRAERYASLREFYRHHL
ncbi:MAG: cation:proton antiporter [Sterolibacterium sp.]|jgi:CPA2 family monovalent cation:H+ antiporter-2|nr:cation:proton antiporter [Sterolibacterium sp.]